MALKRVVYYAFGTSAGIVIGLLLLRAVLHSVESVTAEFHANRLTYIYVFGATAAVSLFLGYILGRRIQETREQTMIDALTGLYNRLGLHVRLRDEYRRAQRFQTPLTLLLIDIDHLKRINDELGHHAGDQALRGVGRAIKNTLRDTDVGARWGGDEFAIVAPNTAEPAAQRLASRLLAEIPKWAGRDEAVVTASIGVATVSAAQAVSHTPDALMKTADAALYQAKLNGRNQVRAA